MRAKRCQIYDIITFPVFFNASERGTMLRFLAIRNLAIIEEAQIELDSQLSVLTGETGAGKSILVEAVGLLLGGRSSPDLVRTGADCATVQAMFDDEDGSELLVRREVTAQGRSRAFVNGSLVTAAALRELGARLVDLHGQHEHQALLDPETHLDLLDRFAGLEAETRQVADAHEALLTSTADLETIRGLSRHRASRLEMIEYQLAEIDRARPRAGEDEELAQLRTLLSSAERVRRLSEESYSILYDRDDAVLGALAQVWRRVGELADLDPRFSPYLEARETVKSQLEDLASFLRGYAASIDASPERLQGVEDRLALLERLKRKHGPTLADVIAKQQALRDELAGLESLDERLARAEAEVARTSASYLASARELSRLRRAAATRFASAIVGQLTELAMEHTRFEVRFENGLAGPSATWSPRGIDVAEFYLSPNPGEELRPLARIASGGEMSRIMLGIKTLASLDQPGKTLIFDEVDVGIGGRVADAVGAKLRALGTTFQVLCITHLPQIAAYGTRQYRIRKLVRDGRTSVAVDLLDQAGREGELSRMIGGAEVTAAARESAREMLRTRLGESEQRPKGESERAKAKASRR
jgi:DNA repair protein RecN (Recombination protein N)